MKKRKKNEDMKAVHLIARIMLFVIKIPYYIVKGILRLFKKSGEEIEKMKINNKRASLTATYKDFKLLEKEKGDYEKWIRNLYNADSKIGIIIGARGTGKSAFGLKLLENINAKNKKSCFAMGFNENEMPKWISIATDITKIKNDSFVLVDEGGVLFNSRDSMTNINKLLSELILVSRHKNLSILFVSQNSSNLDINILRQADYLILKPSSLLQKEFERKIIQKIYDSIGENFSRFKDDKGATYVYSNDFQGYISNPLPSFWGINISKSFR
ncbi:MAG: zonular occludens toxin domain-containing protein [Candidatus Pacearchaeota archaeon]|jgi:hypothetical protein